MFPRHATQHSLGAHDVVTIYEPSPSTNESSPTDESDPRCLYPYLDRTGLLPACQPASASPMAEKSPGSRRRPGGSASQEGFGGRGNGGVQSEAPQASRFSVGAEQGAQRRPPGRAKGLCSRGGGPGLPSSASGGGRGARGARSRATARPGPGRRSRRRAKRRKRRRRRRLPWAPASFSRAARTR